MSATARTADPLDVAVIGLGRMGGPMADCVIAAGHRVRVFDLSPAAVEPRASAGAAVGSSPADAAAGARVVCVVVFDDAQATEVVTGSDGVLQSLGSDAVLCIHTTATLDTIRRLDAAAEPHGVTVLDCGVSGGEGGARSGTLLSIVGGPADAVDAARPVLDAFSKEVLHAGPLGAGMALKLARNAAGYVMMTAVHEAMELAHGAGVELAELRHALEVTAVFEMAMSPLSFGGPEPLPPDAPEATRAFYDHTRRLGDKDLDHALALAEDLGVSLPAIEATRATFGRVMRL